MNENVTIILQVELAAKPTDVDQINYLFNRFGQWWDYGTQIQYPVTCDSHGFDVFRDEFEDDPVADVDLAQLIELPYPVEQFVPFTEESAGTQLAEWVPGGDGWA